MNKVATLICIILTSSCQDSSSTSKNSNKQDQQSEDLLPSTEGSTESIQGFFNFLATKLTKASNRNEAASYCTQDRIGEVVLLPDSTIVSCMGHDVPGRVGASYYKAFSAPSFGGLQGWIHIKKTTENHLSVECWRFPEETKSSITHNEPGALNSACQDLFAFKISIENIESPEKATIQFGAGSGPKQSFLLGSF